jgi:hypothetical protein
MSLEITKPVLMLIVILVAVGILAVVFIAPMLYDLFVGRNYCKYLGNTFVQLFLGNSILNGPTQGGVSAGCDVAVPV